MSLDIDLKQEKAFEKLSKLKCGAAFMHCGTGKTKVAVTLAESRVKDFDILVWICPASLIKQTKEEIKKWQKISMPIEFFSVESIGMSDNKYMQLVNIAENNACFCVLDESINIKNATAKRTKRLLQLTNKFKYRFILNGTPLTKSLIDLWGQIEFLSPKILKMTETQFANNFLVYKNEGYRPWQKWSKPANEEALIEILRPYIFDCDLDLNVGINYNQVSVQLTDDEILKYSELKKSYFDKIGNNEDDINFFEMTQLFQHCYTNCEEKREKLNSILADIIKRGEKTVIFCKYLDEVEYLKSEYPNVKLFTGEQKDDITDFQTLVCTYGTGSFGLNLQQANNLIYFSQTFDYKHKEQSKARIYRTGQTKDCNIYDFWVDTGLEKIIRKSLNKKENVLNNVKEFIKAGNYEKL